MEGRDDDLISRTIWAFTWRLWGQLVIITCVPIKNLTAGLPNTEAIPIELISSVLLILDNGYKGIL
jgi:hypothetical protein